MILKSNYDDFLLLLTAPDYRYVDRYIVVYGLEVTPCQSLSEAKRVFSQCNRHYKACNQEQIL